MKRILYTKFSNDRDPKFSIRTQIVEDENHKKYIEKGAACKEAETHVKKMGEWEKKLDELFSHSVFSINKRVQIGDKYFFEFVEGDTLEEIIDRELEKRGKEAAISILKKYVATIYSVFDGVTFATSDKFTEVFGDVVFDDGIERKSAVISNIDMILSNIKVVSDSEWVVLDYEWTFDFLIPTDYIVYRIISYYLEGRNKRKIILGDGLYEEFGINSNDQKLFRQMEDHFQKYVLGENVPIRSMHKHLVKPAYDINYTLEQAKERRNYSNIQIFWNYGKGFSEEASWYYEPFADANGIVHLKLDIPDGVIAVRIDPAFSTCIVAVSNVHGTDVNGEKCLLDYTTTGKSLGKGVFLSDDNDPQIIFSLKKDDIKEIYLELEVSLLYEKITDKIADYADYAEKSICQYKELEKHYYTAMSIKADLERRVADLDHRLYIAESNFHAIQGTFAWKITKPLRITLDIIKNIIGRNPKRKIFLKSIKVFIKKGLLESKKYYQEELQRWKTRHIYDKVDRIKEGYIVSDKIEAEDISFSVIVPLYNTPELFLHEMIESVLAQSYCNWELCLADGSDRKHKYVKKICKQYQKADNRVHYKKIRKNLGISGNTNVALDMAKGDYITLFDHDDFLHPYALYETATVIYRENADYVYTDEVVFSDNMFENVHYHFKPDFAPDTLRGVNYICHLSSFSANLLKEVGKFRTECDGSQDYDMILRLTEKANKIIHIPKALYYWRSHSGSVASGIGAKMYAVNGAHVALQDHLNRIGLKGKVFDAEALSSYRIKYDIIGKPLVSIIIPNKDHVSDLDKCISSIKEKSTYSNYEIVIIENNSEEQGTFDYYKEFENDSNINVVYYEGPFNYSAINNFGVQSAKGEYLILLNNDTEVITPEWIEEMLMFAQRQDVGVVGPMLYYSDDTIQHAGLIIGIGGSAGHSHKGFPRGDLGYLYKLSTVQNVSGVTGACLMIATDIYKKLNGLDEQFVVAFNDVDFCLRVRDAGYLNIFTPFAELYHYESKSRGYEDTPEKMKRFENERNLLRARWKRVIVEDGDPYYNPNLTLDREDFGIK